MPIIGLQRRIQELGRIRIGKVVESRGKKRPTTLQNFRLTSRNEIAIIAVAKEYGGKPEPWDNNGRQEWQVETETSRLPVIVPPSDMAFTQFYELWGAGGCQRRCDGENQLPSEEPCVCDPTNRQCSTHTRLSVLLRDIPGLGLWRLDTEGYYASVELSGAVETINMAAQHGQMLPATLRLEQRQIKRQDEPRRDFAVPVLDLDITPAQLMMGTISIEPPKQITPVPAKAPAPNISEQMQAVDRIQSSTRRAADIKPTGIAPRSASEAQQASKGRAPTVVKVTGEFHPNEPSPDPVEVAHHDVAANDDPEAGQGGLFDAGQPEVKKINQQQVGILIGLFNQIGMPTEGNARMQWCVKQIGHPIDLPSELTEGEAILLITKATMMHRIRRHYETDDMDVILVDLTQYLQRDNKLRSIDDMTDDEIAIAIEAVDMAETTGRKILGITYDDGGYDETTPETEIEQP